MRRAAARAALAVVAVSAALHACPAFAADDSAPVRQRALATVADWTAFDFKLPEELTIDAGLRRQIEALAAEHRARVAELAVAWADEAARSEPDGKVPDDLQMRLLARYFNELSLWQLDTTGEEHDRRMLAVLKDPATCRDLKTLPTALGQVALALQRMVPPDREAALSAHRVLLARWGHHSTVAERPVPSLKERALAAARALRGFDRAAQEPPLPPVLAWALLKTATPALVAQDELCALIAWDLQRAPSGTAPPGEQALLARYAIMEAWMSRVQAKAPGISEGGYPNAAARFGVQGDVVAKGRLRSDGAGMDAPRIVARRISVPGIPDARPVAFETWLDSATLDRATKTAPTATPAPGGETEVRFSWKLQ